MNTETNTKTNEHAELKAQILEYSRQKNIRPLTPWLDRELDRQIEKGRYPTVERLRWIGEKIIKDLKEYKVNHKIDTGIIGMSGGVDSALTASLFKKAGWRVIGVTLPIHQNPEETERGIEAIRALGLEEMNVDLTPAYDSMLQMIGDDALAAEETHEARIRRGNLKARLRMITQMNLASKHRGTSLSSDNSSELALGFWSIFGDQGMIAPIQSLNKSWEVPMLAQIMNVPEKTVRAKPTDGLGVLDAGKGDEDQFGASYLEMDLMFYALYDAIMDNGSDIDTAYESMKIEDEITQSVFVSLTSRMRSTVFKRNIPHNTPHPIEDRYEMIDTVDKTLAPHLSREVTKKFSP